VVPDSLMHVDTLTHVPWAWGSRRGWTSTLGSGARTDVRGSAASTPLASRCSTGSTKCQINSYAEPDGPASRPRSSGDDSAPSAVASPSRDDRLTLVSRQRSTVFDATGAVKDGVMIVILLQRGVVTGPLNRPLMFPMNDTIAHLSILLIIYGSRPSNALTSCRGNAP